MATITKAGAIPTDPLTLRTELVAAATALSPGLTADLPASLVEDLASTATGALVVQDQTYVDLVNSISPTTANDYILTQLGNVYGVQQGLGSNTSVYVQFAGTPGFVINVGFQVSDGTYIYVVQDATSIATSGLSASVYCVATTSGTWAVPENTVTSLITSVPAGFAVTCTNPATGIPGTAPQTTQEYRAQVIQAGNAIATGTPQFVKTTLQKVPGVQARLISFKQLLTGWRIIVGGGDPYQVANAIYQSMFNFDDLKPSQGFLGTGSITDTVLTITSVDLRSIGELAIGSVVYGAGIAVGTQIQSLGTGTGGVGTYNILPTQTAASTQIRTGGTNQLVALSDYPDVYEIFFVVPFQQTVSINVNWNTIASSNFVSNTVVTSLVQPALVSYINNIFVSQAISLLELNTIFTTATIGVLNPVDISELVWTVIIDNLVVTPDPILYPASYEAFYFTTAADILVTNV